MPWNGGVYLQHVTIEGLAMGGGIQGNIADATLAILKYHKVDPDVKCMDDFVFFWIPLSPLLASQSSPSFKFDLSVLMRITSPFGIPWHSFFPKGHDFQPTFSYIGLEWNLAIHSVSFSTKKNLHLLSKVSSIIQCLQFMSTRNKGILSMAPFSTYITTKAMPIFLCFLPFS